MHSDSPHHAAISPCLHRSSPGTCAMPPSSAAARRPANEDVRVVAAGAAIAGSVSLTQGAGPRGQRQMSSADPSIGLHWHASAPHVSYQYPCRRQRRKSRHRNAEFLIASACRAVKGIAASGLLAFRGKAEAAIRAIAAASVGSVARPAVLFRCIATVSRDTWRAVRALRWSARSQPGPLGEPA